MFFIDLTWLILIISSDMRKKRPFLDYTNDFIDLYLSSQGSDFIKLMRCCEKILLSCILYWNFPASSGGWSVSSSNADCEYFLYSLSFIGGASFALHALSGKKDVYFFFITLSDSPAKKSTAGIPSLLTKDGREWVYSREIRILLSRTLSFWSGHGGLASAFFSYP